MTIEHMELLTRVRNILGLSERELAHMTFTQTIEKLVEVIENGRAD